MPETTFARALTAAAGEAGLSLRQLQYALARRGTTVSVATLSYWCSGRSQPERGAPAAMAALEDVLGVPAGELAGLVGERRPRGRGTPAAQEVHRLANVWGGPDSLRDALGRLTVPPLRTVARHETLFLDHNGANRRLVTSVTLRATGPARTVVALVRGTATDRIPTLGRTRGCSLRRAHVVADQGIALLELDLGRSLSTADTRRIWYEVLFDDDVRSDHWFHRPYRTPGELRVTVVFETPATPAEVTVVAPGPHPGPHLSRARATASTRNARPGCFGLRWSWPGRPVGP
ncbi:helix-turn-helix transcriptional regulator [Amycolatopsis sp. NBC_00345]|uniref:helix-turn-helix domain-containing protein n=1 Tax=Amycolatopsis sp. NBC_00345 TaxID=2975955 RepID=UPI002E253BB1